MGQERPTLFLRAASGRNPRFFATSKSSNPKLLDFESNLMRVHQNVLYRFHKIRDDLLTLSDVSNIFFYNNKSVLKDNSFLFLCTHPATPLRPIS